MFIVTTGKKYLPDEKLILVRDKLEKMDSNKLAVLQSLHYKDPLITLLLSILLGFWGVDRFIFKQSTYGFLKLITIGGFGIWYIIDCFTAMKRARESNLNLLLNTLE
jgi:TM2 domain-containing membrane protein YozV